MEAATIFVRPTVANRVVGCLWCHRPSTHAEVIRNRGLCAACTAENVAISWRLIYDRDRKVGSIPANLRVAYRL
ncbi:MAG TPA: hypothetical protein VNO74_10515 [Methylomirabilota bacterium]|jgi:hypothetical protein|nr:hypothetical protein [Methylomirabilota bacterium]